MTYDGQKADKRKKLLVFLGILWVLILALTALFAYFQIHMFYNNINLTNTDITDPEIQEIIEKITTDETSINGIGKNEKLGTPTLFTNETSLGLVLTADMMSKDKIGYKYYATPNNKGIGLQKEEQPTINQGIYELAKISLDKGDELDCTVSYTLSAVTTKPLEKDSINVYVIVTDGNNKKTYYTLYQLLYGIEYTGNITSLKPGEKRNIYIESYVENVNRSQVNLSGVKFTIRIVPKEGSQGFNCELANNK